MHNFLQIKKHDKLNILCRIWELRHTIRSLTPGRQWEGVWGGGIDPKVVQGGGEGQGTAGGRGQQHHAVTRRALMRTSYLVINRNTVSENWIFYFCNI